LIAITMVVYGLFTAAAVKFTAWTPKSG